jgi:hypothetical protein
MTIDIRNINLLTHTPQRLANALIYSLIAFTSISCGSDSNQEEINEEAIKKLTTELGEVKKIAEEAKDTATKAQQLRSQETESQEPNLNNQPVTPQQDDQPVTPQQDEPADLNDLNDLNNLNNQNNQNNPDN